MPSSFDAFSVFDIETSSKHPLVARIVQYGVVEFSKCDAEWTITRRHVALVDPGSHIPDDATSIHGIDDAAVATAPTTPQSLPRLLQLLRGRVLVGYNVVDFDVEVLRAECLRHGLVEDFYAMTSSLRGIVDVMPWAARTTTAPLYRKGARTLSTMSVRHGVELTSAHDAGDDATATGRLMLNLMASGLMPGLNDVVEATWETWRHLRRRGVAT